MSQGRKSGSKIVQNGEPIPSTKSSHHRAALASTAGILWGPSKKIGATERERVEGPGISGPPEWRPLGSGSASRPSGRSSPSLLLLRCEGDADVGPHRGCGLTSAQSAPTTERGLAAIEHHCMLSLLGARRGSFRESGTMLRPFASARGPIRVPGLRLQTAPWGTRRFANLLADDCLFDLVGTQRFEEQMTPQCGQPPPSLSGGTYASRSPI
jgi:hypothetical protein